MSRWKLSELATMDITAIFADGISRFGSSQATKYRDDLGHALDTLASSPRIGREHFGAEQTVRVHFHQAHVVVYIIEHTAILIIRVLPTRSDWKEAL